MLQILSCGGVVSTLSSPLAAMRRAPDSLSFRPEEEWLMNPTTGIVVIVGLIVVLAIAWMFFRQKRSKDLREHFGPEYDRLAHEKGNARRAEAELAEREQRVKRLSIRPLPKDEATR